ncbi:MAG: hypothetical protein LBM08_14540 [Dysgonamonadaceae bacterium]|jgi:hypothetical protein|nr:hypothetical protein [Dysgonamonadaceae bacterium]
MLDCITTYDNLYSEAKEIQSYSEITVSDNPQEIVERMISLGVYIARTGKMLADAKYHLNEKRKDETMQLIERILSDKKLSAKVQNSLIDSISREEQYLVDWIERLNRSITHQMEEMRSLLSYEKENLRISKTGY